MGAQWKWWGAYRIDGLPCASDSEPLGVLSLLCHRKWFQSSCGRDRLSIWTICGVRKEDLNHTLEVREGEVSRVRT